MKIAGMIGGLGPESTVDYYRLIIAGVRARNGQGAYPELLISSLDLAKGIELVDGGRLDELAEYLVGGVQALARAGAAFGFFSANTPHIVFDQVQQRSPIPLLSIVRAACDRVKALGLNKVGLFGTGFTMRGSFYPREFQRAEIGLVTPNAAEMDFIHQKYLGELLNNQFVFQTRDRMVQIARRMKSDDGIDAILLAGTELPLLLREAAASDIRFLDTTEIHVAAIVDEILR